MVKMPKQSVKSFGLAFSFKKRTQNNRKFKKKKVKPFKEIVNDEIKDLQERIDAGIDPSKVNSFSDFPLSKNTLNGLRKAKFSNPTDIQKQAISLALQGKDVLGAAKTGSGKTLAFLIPVLEVLHKAKMSSAFGMGALIITPTRELAFQIFEDLQKILVFHDFTANAIFGGKHLWREERMMANTNIVVCTVGRLLQHLDQTSTFNADELKILVLDEADRMMGIDFARDMDRIIDHLPQDRQTLLFSATQTKEVKALARLRLKSPSYVSVDEHAEHATPATLKESYMVCELHEKLSMLYSFLKNLRSAKVIVFLQTCKQVKYVHSVLKRESQGRPVLSLYGTLNQMRRIQIYQDFCRKQHVVLLATDLACRGLDFPDVDWVVQYDCPVDVDTYIHRVGRTARFERNGQALLMLMPSEEDAMVQALTKRKIPINKISVNMKKVRDITGSTGSACATCTETKDMAERAFRNYIFSLHKMKNSPVDVLDLDKFAKSLGLFLTPKLRFLKQKKTQRDIDLAAFRDDEDSGTEDLFSEKPVSKPIQVEEERGNDEEEEEEEKATTTTSKKKTTTKAALVKKLKNKNINPNTRVVFDEDGAPIKDAYKRRHEDDDDDEEDDEGGINLTAASKRLRREDAFDKQIERKRVKEKHREERIKKKEKKREAQQQQKRAAEEEEEEDEEEGAVLEGGAEDDPFQYIPDPDKLAARNQDDDDEDGNEDDSDDDDASDDEADLPGNQRNQDDSSDDDDEDDDDEDDSSSDGGMDDQEQRRSLEAQALGILKKARLT